MLHKCINGVTYCYVKETHPYTIAIIEDHELVRQTFINRLTLFGYKVVIEAENGKAFLEQLEKST